MDRNVRSVVDLGTRGAIVEVECHISNNLPAIVIIGSASKIVDEAKERVRAAFMIAIIPYCHHNSVTSVCYPTVFGYN